MLEMMPLLVPAVAFMAAAAVLQVLLRCLPSLALDVANERSLHVGTVPRFGGIGVVAGVFAAAAVGAGVSLFWGGPLALIAAVSFSDDRWNLPIALRFCTHAAVAGFSLWLMDVQAGWLAAAAILFLWVWFINLFNFMDGSDGLAGSMAMVGFSGLAWAAFQAGRPDLALPALACVGAAAGFLLFNLPPARIFLGDVGSISLGFLFGALAVGGWAGDAWPAWFPVFVTLPFWLDASLTLGRRLLAGERFWQAHRQHAYQRLVQMGWSHGRLLRAAISLMAADALAAGIALSLPAYGTFMLLALCLLANLAVWVGVNTRWHRFSTSQ